MPEKVDLETFTNSLPVNHKFELVDTEREKALFAVHWGPTAFANLQSFLEFYFCYSSALQPYLCNPKRTDLAEWFCSEQDDVERARSFLADNPPQDGTLGDWISTHYPDFSAPWLSSGDEGKWISSDGMGWPEIVGMDSLGFYAVFAADLL